MDELENEEYGPVHDEDGVLIPRGITYYEFIYRALGVTSNQIEDARKRHGRVEDKKGRKVWTIKGHYGHWHRQLGLHAQEVRAAREATLATQSANTEQLTRRISTMTIVIIILTFVMAAVGIIQVLATLDYLDGFKAHNASKSALEEQAPTTDPAQEVVQDDLSVSPDHSEIRTPAQGILAPDHKGQTAGLDPLPQDTP